MANRSIPFASTVLVFVAVFAVAANGAPYPNNLESDLALKAAIERQIQFNADWGVEDDWYWKNLNNWGASGNVGVGVHAWESENGRHSLGVGASYGGSFGTYNGHPFMRNPHYGVGLGYSFRFRR